MRRFNRSLGEILDVRSDGEIIADGPKRDIEFGESRGEFGAPEGDEGEGSEGEDSAHRGDDLVLCAGGEEDADGDEHTAKEDEADVAGEDLTEVGAAVNDEEGEIDEGGEEEDEVEAHGAKEFAEDEFEFGDGTGAEHFHAAGAVFIREDAHRHQGNDEEEGEAGQIDEVAQFRRLSGHEEPCEKDAHEEHEEEQHDIGYRRIKEGSDFPFGDGENPAHKQSSDCVYRTF